MLSEPLLIDRNLSWHAWFKSAGLMEAAVAGQGIALGRLSFTRSDILAGKLVRLSQHSLHVSYCHYAVYPDLFGVQPSLGGFPGLADRRGPSCLGS
jgi:LysR family glycine cleavage system transcriptional activator